MTTEDLAGLDIAKRSVRGSLILFAGSFSSAVIGTIASILITRLLGPTQYGVYALAMVIPGILQLFVGFGVNTAVIRYSAYYISLGKPEEARRFTVNAIYFLCLTGVLFVFLDYVLAGTLSSLLLQRPDLTPYVQLMSIYIFGNMVLLTVTSAAIGWNWMGLSSISQVAQSVVKLVLSPLLILVGLGVTGALVGQVASYVAAGSLGTLALYLARLRGSAGGGRFVADVKEMLGFGLPVYAGGLVVSLASSYVTVILALIVSNTVYGLVQAATNFVSPVTLVSSSLVNALFPAFASIDGIGGNVQLAFRKAYKFVAFLLTPVIFFIVAVPSLLIHIVYGGSFSGSAPYLQLLGLAFLPIAFGYSVHPAFFAGFGRPKLTMFVYLTGAAALLVFAPLLSIEFGLKVDGIIATLFLSYLAAWAIGTILAARYMHATLDLKANGAILVVSAASCVVTALLPKVPFSNVLTLLVSLVVFFGIYLTLAPLAGIVNRSDLDILERTFSDLRAVRFLFGLLLGYERLILSLSRRG